MQDPWIGFIGALAGALVVGIFHFLNARSQFKWNKEWERKTLLRGKLEDLFTAIGDLRDAYIDIYSSCVTRQPNQQTERLHQPVERLRMLVGFYAPEVRPFLTKLEQARLEFGRNLLTLIESQESHHTQGWSDSLDRLGASFRRLDAVFDEMEEELVRLSRHRLPEASGY